MNVLIDLRMLSATTGVGRYLFNLVREWPGLGSQQTITGLAHEHQDIPLGIRVERLTGWRRCVQHHGALQRLVLPQLVNNTGCDLFHYPYYDPPRGLSRPFVATCYDVEPLKHPELFPRRLVLYHQVFSRNLRHAARVAVISERTGHDIVELLGVDPERVRVTYLGVDDRFHRIADAERLEVVRRKYKLSDPFVLYVGNTMPHKNVGALVRAMAVLQSEFPAIRLIVAGAEDRYRGEVSAIVSRLALQERVRFIGKVAEEDLPTLYTLSSVFAFPSLYEGFGLPVLEAMACGTPVVTSDRGSLPEIVGDTGVVIDPSEPASIAEGIGRILRDAPTSEHLAGRAMLRARSFTWRRCAEQHARMYAEAVHV